MRTKNARLFPTALAFGQNSPSEPFLAIIVKATFRLENRRAPARVAPAQLPVFTSDEPYDKKKPAGPLKFETDQVPFKPRADIVLVGKAHAPHGRPVPSLDVQIAAGQTQRTLRVFGDRLWSFASLKDPMPLIVGPADFVEMPLTADRSFGGSDEQAGLNPNEPWFRPWCERNFLGRGFCGARTIESIHQKPLPNLEDPKDLVRSWDSRPIPVGCGFSPRNSKPRSLFAGTYDEKWKAERAPAPPEDFRFDLFNGADPSLQVKGYLVGNEHVMLENVTPGGGLVEFWLPCLRPILTVTRGAAAIPVPANLDTLVFVPDDGVFYQVWRGLVGIEKPDASDVEEIRIEYNELEAAPQVAFGQGARSS